MLPTNAVQLSTAHRLSALLGYLKIQLYSMLSTSMVYLSYSSTPQYSILQLSYSTKSQYSSGSPVHPSSACCPLAQCSSVIPLYSIQHGDHKHSLAQLFQYATIQLRSSSTQQYNMLTTSTVQLSYFSTPQ